ncbi:acyl-CoA dehydrogenase family protein [Pseudonocardia sp. RS010]|uniref:acyl-CoA dehydrogenase family protein n=1 Tax=Pseudonocardia sp. RS010 TaxID=3385979 RepID=UPI0039A16497
MDFDFTPEQDALRAAVREMMDREAPEEYLSRLDREHLFPHELWRRWVEMDLLAMPFPARYGGLDGGVLEFVITAEEIGRKGYDLSGAYGMAVFLGLLLVRHGSPEQAGEIVPGIVRGERRLSISITEPEAGSDAGAMRTFARADGEDFVIDGQKVFSTGAGLPDNTILLFARTSREDRKAISCFLVPNDAPGLKVVRLDTLGRHSMGTFELFLDGVRVPAANLVGELHGGWDILLAGLELERTMTCAAYVGNAQTVVDQALAHARGREQFGRPIGDFQAIAHMLADMQTAVDAARLLTYRAATLVAQGRPARQEVAMAKLFGSETFVDVANKGMQVLGGYSYMMEVPMQRHFRDARITTVTAGTSQMQRNHIARGMGLRPR